jgi:uncharacterized protein YbjT (DUF2867 family)
VASQQVVLVSGATDIVGRHLVAKLLARGQRVRAGVRRPGEANLTPGVDQHRLDFDDPSTASSALKGGVDRVFLMHPPAISDVRTALGPFVAACRERRVRQVVVLSVLGANPAMPHWWMERMVRDAGLRATALRPAYFARTC